MSITAEQIDGLLDHADRVLHEQIPARQEFFTKVARANEWAEANLPELADPKSAFTAEVNAALANNPVIKALPHHKPAAAAYVLGQKVMQLFGPKAVSILSGLEQKQKAQIAKAKMAPKAPAAPARPAVRPAAAPQRAAAPAASPVPSRQPRDAARALAAEIEATL